MRKNYLEVRTRIPFRSSFYYVDTVDYISADIFEDHDLYWVTYSKKEFYNEETGIIISKCSFFTRDKEKFFDSMEHLRRKLEFLGYDMELYDNACDKLNLVEDILNFYYTR